MRFLRGTLVHTHCGRPDNGSMDAVRSWLHLLGHGISSLPGEISGGEDEEEAAEKVVKQFQPVAPPIIKEAIKPVYMMLKPKD